MLSGLTFVAVAAVVGFLSIAVVRRATPEATLGRLRHLGLWQLLAELLKPRRPHVANRDVDLAYWGEVRDRLEIDDMSATGAAAIVDGLVRDGRLVAAPCDSVPNAPLPSAFAAFLARHGDVRHDPTGLFVGGSVAVRSADGRLLLLGGDDTGLVVMLEAAGAEPSDRVFVADAAGAAMYEPIPVAPTIDHFLVMLFAEADPEKPDGSGWSPADFFGGGDDILG